MLHHEALQKYFLRNILNGKKKDSSNCVHWFGDAPYHPYSYSAFFFSAAVRYISMFLCMEGTMSHLHFLPNCTSQED